MLCLGLIKSLPSPRQWGMNSRPMAWHIICAEPSVIPLSYPGAPYIVLDIERSAKICLQSRDSYCCLVPIHRFQLIFSSHLKRTVKPSRWRGKKIRVTRFGEIPPLWQIFRWTSLGIYLRFIWFLAKFFNSLWHNLYAFGQIFQGQSVH